MTTLSESADTHKIWMGMPVKRYSGSIQSLQKIVPAFDRQPFAVACPERQCTGFNNYYDTIVRMPLDGVTGERPVPVGIVSKSYVLVQHKTVLDIVLGAFKNCGIDATKVPAVLEITEHGERMHLLVQFPDDERYMFGIGKDDKMALRFECFNSVEGSTRFSALLGWYRFICGNGMVVGVAQTTLRRTHNFALDVTELPPFLNQEISDAVNGKRIYEKWLKAPVSEQRLAGWINGPLQKEWGVNAAARAFHIARTGHDGDVPASFEKELPTEKTVSPGVKVPGSFVPTRNAFAVSQALSWIAGQYREIPKQVERKSQIPELIKSLICLN